MSMVYCRACGGMLHETAPTCPHCGAIQPDFVVPERLLERSTGVPTLHEPYIATLNEPYVDEVPRLQAPLYEAEPTRSFDTRMLLSERWQRRFALVEQAGGVGLPRKHLLTLGEQFWIGFCFFAWFFGPLWYLLKGMWRKAITLFVLMMALEFLAGVVFYFGFGREMSNLAATMTTVAVSYYLFGARAVMDYYKAVVLDDRSWL